MGPEKFEKLVTEIFCICKNTLVDKSREYSRDGDKLSNFKKAGRIGLESPEKALLGMLLKHWVSVIDMIHDIDNNTYHLRDVWIEKIKDCNNYLILLLGLLDDMGHLKHKKEDTHVQKSKNKKVMGKRAR